MPTELSDAISVEARFCRTLDWEEYEVKDSDVLATIMEEHAERRDEVGFDDGFSFREEADGRTRTHLFYATDDGVTTQVYAHADDEGEAFDAATFMEDEVDRHATIAEHRLNALVGRANKTVELAAYIEQFEEYGVAATVLDEYREGPVLSGDWLEQAILQEHGRETLDDIPDHLFARPGEYEPDDECYDEAVAQVTRGELYDESGAGVLDTEAVTKQRRFSDYYTDGEDAAAMRSIYDTVLDCVASSLER